MFKVPRLGLRYGCWGPVELGREFRDREAEAILSAARRTAMFPRLPRPVLAQRPLGPERNAGSSPVLNKTQMVLDAPPRKCLPNIWSAVRDGLLWNCQEGTELCLR